MQIKQNWINFKTVLRHYGRNWPLKIALKKNKKVYI